MAMEPRPERENVFFRKKTSVSEFAEMLIRFHAQRFSRDALMLLISTSGIMLEDSRFANALVEWVIFGIYSVRNGVSGNCKEDVRLRNAILDVFFDKLYSGLAASGFTEEELPQFEEDVRLRFGEYDSIVSGNDAHRLGKTAARHILGEDKLAENPKQYEFAMLVLLHFADSAPPLSDLFRNCKIVA
jgi:hypothetical protein